MALLRSLLAFSFALALPMTSLAETSTAETFGQMPETWSAVISPDGRYLALGCSPTGIRAVCLYEMDSTAKPRLILPPEEGRLEGLTWASADYLIYTVEIFDTIDTVDGLVDLNIRRMVSYNVKNSKSRILMRNVGGFADTTGIDSRLLDKPDKIQTSVSYRLDGSQITGRRVGIGKGEARHIIYEVDLKSGKAKPTSTSSRSIAYIYHDAKGAKLAQLERNYRKKQFAITSLINGRKTIFERGKVELAPFRVDGIARGGQGLVVHFDDGERFGLYVLSLIDGAITPFEWNGDPVGDVTTVDDPFTNEIIGYSYTDHLPQRVYIEERFAKVAADAMAALQSDSVILTSWTPDRTVFTLLSIKTGRPDQYYIYDTATPSISPIGGEAPWLDAAALGMVVPASYPARDGLEISAYLTYPPGKSETDGPLPLLMLPHGGPEARDTAGFNWLAQAFAAEGYLVMQPNFRGSAGYGTSFRDAGYGEFGGKMVDDVIDGAGWAISQGLARDKYCTLGWSYGGYSSLMTALKDKTSARCAVSINGVSDPKSVFTDTDNESPVFAYWEQYLGDFYKTKRSEMRTISPQARAAEYDMPVLLLHGREDTTVNVRESQAMARNLKDHTEVELVLFDGDDHQLARTQTRQTVLARSIAFLAEHHPARD